jgi:hypothetical protein
MQPSRTHRKHIKTKKPFERKWLLVGAVVALSIIFSVYLSLFRGFSPTSFSASLFMMIGGTVFLVFTFRDVLKFAQLDKHGFITFLHHELPLSAIKRRGIIYPDDGSYWLEVISRFVVFFVGSVFSMIGLIGIIRGFYR